MRKRKKRNNDDEINMTPLIDVIFLILIYFFVIGHNNMSSFSIKLPKYGKSIKNQQSSIIESNLIINSNGRIDILTYEDNNKKSETKNINIEDLTKYINKEYEINILADKETKYDIIINVVNNLKNKGVEKINLKTSVQSDGNGK